MIKKHLSRKRECNISSPTLNARRRIPMRRLALGITAGAIVGAGIALLAASRPAPLHHGWDSWWHDWWHAGWEIGQGCQGMTAALWSKRWTARRQRTPWIASG